MNAQTRKCSPHQSCFLALLSRMTDFFSFFFSFFFPMRCAQLSGDVNAKVSAPWASPQDLQVTFGKKFSVGALSDLGLNSIRNFKGE